MTRTERILQAIVREERKRESNPPKSRPSRKPRPRKRISWDRPLPHELGDRGMGQ